MKLLITDKIYTDKKITISSFTEYGMLYENIETSPISVQKMKNSNKSYSRILLIPNTHIINLWHLMHHIFIAYKFIKKNNYTSDIVYPIFFKNFHHRQGDVTKCRYNELIFKGLNLDFSTFTEMNTLFIENHFINIDRIDYVNETINFNNEPLFNNFKKTILNNLDVKYRSNSSKIVTFILRRGAREITNIDYVKDKLKSYSINYIYLEDHTIKEQLEMIANTDLLIGVHGAGLTWCTFMKNHSKLIELYLTNFSSGKLDNYLRWCKISRVKYERLCIKPLPNILKKDIMGQRVNLNDEYIKAIKLNLQN